MYLGFHIYITYITLYSGETESNYGAHFFRSILSTVTHECYGFHGYKT
jgi:hypothetical protein